MSSITESVAHGGDAPIQRMRDGKKVTSHPGLACPHCPARFFGDRYIEHVQTKHPGQPFNHVVDDDQHEIAYHHYFTRQHPHFFILSDKKSGKMLANMNLDAKGKLQGIETHPDYQRQGLATKLWNYAKSQSDIGIPEPKHSDARTKAGEAWAKKVGGELPPRAGHLLNAQQMQGMIDFYRDR